MISLKNIKPINNGRLIISGAGFFLSISPNITLVQGMDLCICVFVYLYLCICISKYTNTPDITLVQGMDETTLKIIGWQSDMFKGTNVSKVDNFHLSMYLYVYLYLYLYLFKGTNVSKVDPTYKCSKQ